MKLRNRTIRLFGMAFLVVTAAAGAVEAGATKTVNVDCSRGQTIQQALDQFSLPGRPLIVNIKGTCTENVVVTADDTTLAADPAATVTSPDPLQNTLLVNGAARVTIQNLLVSGGRNGIAVISGGSATVQSNTIQHNGSHGVLVYQSAQALVHGNTISNNGGAGVFVESAAATVTSNIVQANGSYGVAANNNAGARIGITDQNAAAANTISDNGLDGVGIFNGSNAYVFSNTIQGNTRDGVLISRASGRLLGSNTIR